MDQNKEYHDPDYPAREPPPPGPSADDQLAKIKSIIRREFSKELEARENEAMLLDQRMTASRRLLHRLRYKIVLQYYTQQKLQLSAGHIQDEIAAQRDPRARDEVASLLTGQRELHPSVRKLIGKSTVDMDEIFRTREPRNKSKKDYVAMLQKRNYTISADCKTKTLRPGAEPSSQEDSAPPEVAPRKLPRHVDPKPSNVLTLVEPTRNKIKHRYRIIIGNTSKYVPAASRLDRSTHKWLLYIRGPPRDPPGGQAGDTPDGHAAKGQALDSADLSRVLTAVTVTLHHSYAPHHIVHLDKPPYHISRRGWGEFPAKVELHFPLPESNRPTSVAHTIKLDRNYTGLQVLGSETVIDVWLYSTPEMLPYEFKEDDGNSHTLTQANEQTDRQTDLLPEIKTESTAEQDDWMDFFTKTTELDVDEMIIKPTKKQEPIVEENHTQEDLNTTQLIQNIKTEVEEHNDNTDLCNENHTYNQNHHENPNMCNDNLNDVIHEIKTEPQEVNNETIIQTPVPITNQPTAVKKRIVKYIDPTTGKIYYLEMDRELDLTKVQEIIINNTAAKISPTKSNGIKNTRKKKGGGISLLKPEVKSLLKSEFNKERLKPLLAHIENDHCYLAAPKVLPRQIKLENVSADAVEEEVVEVKKETNLYSTICGNMYRFNSVRSAVNYLVKKIPLVSEDARDPDFSKHFPFVVDTSDRYWKYDFAKRRNIEWSRAKLIQRILSEHFRHPEPIWRTKQILVYCRMHGHYPVRDEVEPAQPTDSEWSSWTDTESRRRLEGDIKELFPHAADICTLTAFRPQLDRSSTETFDISDEEEIDVVSTSAARAAVRAPPPALRPLAAPREADRLRYLFVETKCLDIGIELRQEDVGNGYSYSAVHAVLVSAMKSFAEELVRTALAERRRREQPPDRISVWTGSPSTRSTISLVDIYSAARSPRLRILTASDLGTTPKQPCAI